MVFHGFERFWGQDVWQPVPACAAGLDPPNINFSDSGGLDLEAWCLDAGCRQDWNGLEEVTEVTEGIGMEGGNWKKFAHARASGARRIQLSCTACVLLACGTKCCVFVSSIGNSNVAPHNVFSFCLRLQCMRWCLAPLHLHR